MMAAKSYSFQSEYRAGEPSPLGLDRLDMGGNETSRRRHLEFLMVSMEPERGREVTFRISPENGPVMILCVKSQI